MRKKYPHQEMSKHIGKAMGDFHSKCLNKKFQRLSMELSTFEQIWAVIESVKAYHDGEYFLKIIANKLYGRALDLADDIYCCEAIITSYDCPEFVRKMACQKWKQIGVKKGISEYTLDNRLKEIMGS